MLLPVERRPLDHNSNMSRLQLASLLLLACTGHVFGGLLPPSNENQGYQYNRPNEVAFGDLTRRGYEPIDRFAGFARTYTGRPDFYRAPGFVNYAAGNIPRNYQGFEDNRLRPYNFQYEVRDLPNGNNYDQREVSDGSVVRGEYRVLLPDSRTQIVKYTADNINGYNADVQYEGQAQFPRNAAYQGEAFGNALLPGRTGGYRGLAAGFLGAAVGNQYLPPVTAAYTK